MWAGRPGVLSADDVTALNDARDAGVAHAEDVARAHFCDDDEKARRAAEQLRDKVSYALGEREQAGLRKFLDVVAALGIAANMTPLQFY